MTYNLRARCANNSVGLNLRQILLDTSYFMGTFGASTSLRCTPDITPLANNLHLDHIGMPAPQLPLDVFLHMIEFIDEAGDLLSLALTNHALHTLVVPRHINYRRISCVISSDHVWKHLLDTPGACFRIRYLDIRLGSRTVFPKMCKINDQGTLPVHGRFYTLFLQTLSKMVNLKVLKYDTEGSRDKTTWAISEAIEKASCELEELEVRAQSWKTRSNTLVDVSPQYNEIPEFSLFHDYLPSLQKYTIQGYGDIRNNGVFIQMLLNAPNLTHMNIIYLPLSGFLSGHWPNLQHLVSHKVERNNPVREPSEIQSLREFFHRHSKLITLSTDGILHHGWAIKSDDFLPNLRSFGITAYASDYGVTTIPSSIAARLTHLHMTTQLQSYLRRHGTVLYNLETCLYLKPHLGISFNDLVVLIPNVQKLYVSCRGPLETLQRSRSENTPRRVTIGLVRSFANYKRLRVLIGPFDNIEVSDNDDPLFKFLYSFPSLLYTRAELRRNGLQEFIRLKRDNIAKVMRYIPEDGCPAECDMSSWGGFYGYRNFNDE